MSDSDSDTDLLPNNILTFQSGGTTVSAKGPNINSTNISSLSFRNNVMTSTMNMPYNMGRPRYAESVCEQRSMYYNRDRDREISPMSFHSASGMQARNLQHSYYPGGMSSHRSMYNGRSGSPQRSMYNGRSGSPMSVRTIDSNTSMSAKDIAFAFQNGTFNKFDFKIIKDAYNRFMKSRTRKRVEKRRNVRMFLKGFRRKSGGDSGDQASNSSISSDDCRSTRTSRSTICKGNMSSCRSTKTDILDFRRTMRDSNMVKDCSENFRNNSFKSMVSGSASREREMWQSLQQKWQNNSMANNVPHLQRDRFKSSFLLPSQRFNHSVASLPIPEKTNRLQSINEGNSLDIRSSGQNKNVRQHTNSHDTDSESEEIFGDVTVMEKTSVTNNTKRSIEDDDIPASDKKRTKLSPPKNNPKPKTPKQNQLNSTKQKSNDFVFAKPQLPLKKLTIAKQQKSIPKSSQQSKSSLPPKDKPVQIIPEIVEQPVEKVISSSQKAVEKLISKSSRPLESVQLTVEMEVVREKPQNIEQEKEQCLPTDTTQHSTTDMSMRPSFIKRKLFTQKVDVAEKNSSSDSLQTDSPQTNVYSKIQKEKNRARKLVTSQSCLNRDVGDDSNLLDLIHKIVPANRMNVTTATMNVTTATMNVTTATNRTETLNNKSDPTNAEKWDVTSVITSCNNTDDVSDTYTDEEIFTKDVGEKQQKNKSGQQKIEGKQSQSNEQTKGKPPETKKKALNAIKEKSAGKENTNSNEEIPISKPPEPMKRTLNEIREKSTYGNDSSNINIEMSVNTLSKQAYQQIASTLKPPVCSVVIEKIPPHNFKGHTAADPCSPTERNGLIKANIYKGVKSFWDTDAESDLETTPLKRSVPKNAVATMPERIAEAPVEKVIAPVNKLLKTTVVETHLKKVSAAVNKPQKETAAEAVFKKVPGKKPEKEVIAEPPLKKVTATANKPQNGKLPQNRIKEMKRAINQKLNSSLVNKEKETELNNNFGKPTNMNKPNEKEIEKNKTKAVENVVKSNKKTISASTKENQAVENVVKTNKKTISASTKENHPPNEEPDEVKKQHNTSKLNTLKKSAPQQKKNQQTTSKKAISKINNNDDSTLSNNDSQHITIHNTTLRIRAQRKPKINRCCGEQDISHNVTNNTVLCRSLRTRDVDISTADESNTTQTQKPTTKNKKLAKSNKVSNIIRDNTQTSDVSFTLTTEVSPSNRTLRNRRSNLKQQKLRQSDVSFTLTSDNKSLNGTISTRSSKRNRELESLQNNSASLYKSGKRSPLRTKIAVESRALNTSNMRFNRSRRLL